MERREFLRWLGVTAGTAAATELALPLRLLAAANPDENPLAGSVTRDWEKIYREQYGYDRSFDWVCSPNDTHACRVRAFVRNGIVTRLGNTYDYQTYVAVSVSLTGIAAAGAWRVAARAGDALALVTVATVVLAAGALRRSPGALPMLSRSVPEARIFRVAAGSALTGAGLSLIGVWHRGDVPYALIDAIRHLLAIGVIGAVVIAMTFRLIPVLEGRPLPWPALRAVALWALIAAVALRTAQAWLPPAWREVSGVLAAIAFACPAANLVLHRTRHATSPD